MRRYKPDMMTVLVILVAIGVITTASIQAQEAHNRQPAYMQASANCIDVFSSPVSCRSNPGLVTAGVSDSTSPSGSKIWQAHTLDHEDTAHATSFFALKGHSCDKASKLEGPALTAADFTDMKIGLSRYVSIDFEMDDISRLEISGVYLGFKDCWQ